MASRTFTLSTSDPLKGILLDTIQKDKQCLVFVNSKRSAEKEAEDTSKFLKQLNNEKRESFSKELLDVLDTPTRQCERLALCAKSGVAFHHAGLHHKQRELIEDAFRDGTIRVITCTPTLAAGINLPAFRSIIRDVKRFTGHGMDYIPVLEFFQMSGRAGRPQFDAHGEAIAIASTETEKDIIMEKFVHGEPESILSKLAVEPVLRTYVLSLIASRVVRTREGLGLFFSKTFWAHQFKDAEELDTILNRVLAELLQEKFLQKTGTTIEATLLGVRVSELYIDPLTASHFLTCINNSKTTPTTLALLHATSKTHEARPRLRISMKEYGHITSIAEQAEQELITPAPSALDDEYEEHLQAIKTALFFEEWINEVPEETLLEKYQSRPGETRARLNILDWLLYSFGELARVQGKHELINNVEKLRLRLEYGAREELLALLKLKGIGRVRARVLHRNNIKDLGTLKDTPLETLATLLGPTIAKNVREQVVSDILPVSKGKRVGQLGLGGYDE